MTTRESGWSPKLVKRIRCRCGSIDANDETTLSVNTNHGQLTLAIQDIGIDSIKLEAGGLDRKLSVQRLPEGRLKQELSFQRTIPLTVGKDDAIWVAVTTEDGFQAWSSPIYFI